MTANHGITCPHCGASTGYSPLATVKDVEITLGDPRRALKVTAAFKEPATSNVLAFCVCQACQKAFPVRGPGSGQEDKPDNNITPNELTPLWPVRHRPVASEIPSPVREAMEDASSALGAGSLIGAMLAARTALVRAQRDQKEKLQLAEASLKALYDEGRISRFEFESSNVARKWANFLGHEQPDPGSTFEREDAEELYRYVEDILDTLYVKWKRMETFRERLDQETGTNGDSSPAS